MRGRDPGGGARPRPPEPRPDRAHRPRRTRRTIAAPGARREGAARPEYGVTTGFGEFKDKPVAPDDLEQLQRNLLLSHSVGVGENSDRGRPRELLPRRRRARRAARPGSTPSSRGTPACAPKLVDDRPGDAQPRRDPARAAARLGRRERRPLPAVAPLRHAPRARGGSTSSAIPPTCARGRGTCGRPPGWRRTSACRGDEADVQGRAGAVNGANFSAAMLALAVHDAERLAEVADAAAALTLEAIAGCTRAPRRRRCTRSAATPGRSRARAASAIARARQPARRARRRGAGRVLAALRPAGARRDPRHASRYARARRGERDQRRHRQPALLPRRRRRRSITQFRDELAGAVPRRRARSRYSAGNFHGQPLALRRRLPDDRRRASWRTSPSGARR